MKTLYIIIGMIVYYIALLITFIFFYAGYFSQIEDVEDQKYFIEVADLTHTCQMPSCTKSSDKYMSLTVKSQFKSHANIPVENKANFTIYGGNGTFTNHKSYTDSEKYLHITEQGDGNYYASIETEYVEVPYEEQYDNYYTTAQGYYCTDHVKPAKDIITTELADAMKKDPFYVFCMILFPWGLLVGPLIYAFVSNKSVISKLSEYYSEHSKKIYRIITFIILPITSILSVVLYYVFINSFALAITFFVLGCISFYLLLSKIAEIFPNKNIPKETRDFWIETTMCYEKLKEEQRLKKNKL